MHYGIFILLYYSRVFVCLWISFCIYSLTLSTILEEKLLCGYWKCQLKGYRTVSTALTLKLQYCLWPGRVVLAFCWLRPVFWLALGRGSRNVVIKGNDSNQVGSVGGERGPHEVRENFLASVCQCFSGFGFVFLADISFSVLFLYRLFPYGSNISWLLLWWLSASCLLFSVCDVTTARNPSF